MRNSAIDYSPAASSFSVSRMTFTCTIGKLTVTIDVTEDAQLMSPRNRIVFTSSSGTA